MNFGHILFPSECPQFRKDMTQDVLNCTQNETQIGCSFDSESALT